MTDAERDLLTQDLAHAIAELESNGIRDVAKRLAAFSGSLWDEPEVEAAQAQPASAPTVQPSGAAGEQPVAWLIEHDAGDQYRAVTLVDPQSSEGAWTGFKITPLYTSPPPVAQARMPLSEEQSALTLQLDILRRYIELNATNDALRLIDKLRAHGISGESSSAGPGADQSDGAER